MLLTFVLMSSSVYVQNVASRLDKGKDKYVDTARFFFSSKLFRMFFCPTVIYNILGINVFTYDNSFLVPLLRIGSEQAAL